MDSVGPTAYGAIYSDMDVRRLVESIVRGHRSPVPRRLNDSERKAHIQSGSIFIFEVAASLTRWTDGRDWTPSRVHGEWLIYREMEAGLSGEERQRARRTAIERRPAITRAGPSYCAPDTVPDLSGAEPAFLVGSMSAAEADKYKIKRSDDALVKWTISVVYGEREYKVVCYFAINDFGTLPHVLWTCPDLIDLEPRQDLKVRAKPRRRPAAAVAPAAPAAPAEASDPLLPPAIDNQLLWDQELMAATLWMWQDWNEDGPRG